MAEFVTRHLGTKAHDIKKAALTFAKGGIVAFPTETVYGLGADARNPDAVARIFSAKGRPAFNPLIIHVHSLDMAREIAEFSPEAEKLARTFWPGPLTLVLPLRDDRKLARSAVAGLKTVGIRVPSAPVAQAILKAYPYPIAAPSANISGGVSATCAQHVLNDLEGCIDAVIDGGRTALGIESTIIASASLRILRYGALDFEEIAKITSCVPQHIVPVPNAIESPGQMLAHYAPHAVLRINAQTPKHDEVYIGFGDMKGANGGLNLSLEGSLVEASANLFDCLRKADNCAHKTGKIAIAPIPKCGLGLAINDRLNRAARSEK